MNLHPDDSVDLSFSRNNNSNTVVVQGLKSSARSPRSCTLSAHERQRALEYHRQQYEIRMRERGNSCPPTSTHTQPHTHTHPNLNRSFVRRARPSVSTAVPRGIARSIVPSEGAI